MQAQQEAQTTDIPTTEIQTTAVQPAVDNQGVYPDPAAYHPTVAELEAGAAILGAECQEACHCGCHAPHHGCDCTQPRGELPCLASLARVSSRLS